MIMLAGFLDITAACIQAYIMRGSTPDIVLEYIASGLVGKEAFSGGVGMQLLGLIVHFCIVSVSAVIFFLAYPKLSILHKSIWINALLIALISWAVTTRIIIPFSKIQPAPFVVSKAFIAIAILYFCVGLPISYFTKQYYIRKNEWAQKDS